MRVAILSDAHLGGPDDPAQALLGAVVETLEADHLVLGGDVFQHWWHFGGEPFPAYAPVVDTLRRRGIPLTVLPGNHDFHAPAFFAAALGARVPDADGYVRATWDGVRVLLHHGDRADTSFGYAAVSAVLRGRPFAALVDTLGPAGGWELLRRLAGHGVVRENPPLIAAQVALAGRLLGEGEGADLVVFGHTHQAGVHVLPGGRYLNAGAFPTVVYVEGGEITFTRAGER